jgi:hypothetical protein
MADLNKGLAERVEVFTRATSDALLKAVGDVLDARNPWQLLYRLSRIVLLGLVLYTAWLLITLQPDLAKRISTTHLQTLQEQLAAHKSQVQSLLRTAIETSGDGLHTLALLQWDGGGSATVLAAAGRLSQQGLAAEQELLLGVEMASALGHLALGLCVSEQSGPSPSTPTQVLPPVAKQRSRCCARWAAANAAASGPCCSASTTSGRPCCRERCDPLQAIPLSAIRNRGGARSNCI